MRANQRVWPFAFVVLPNKSSSHLVAAVAIVSIAFDGLLGSFSILVLRTSFLVDFGCVFATERGFVESW